MIDGSSCRIVPDAALRGLANRGFACFFAFGVDALKNAPAEISFATYFDFARRTFVRVTQFQARCESCARLTTRPRRECRRRA